MFRALEHDGARRRSSDESRQLELCQIMWWMRHIVLGLTLGMGLADRVPVSRSVLVAVALGAELIGHVVVRRRRSLALHVTVVDAFVLLTLTVLGLPTFVVLVVSIGILGWAATFRPLGALASGAVALASVVATWLLHRDALSASTALTGFCLLALIFLARTIRMNMGARRATEREKLVADGIDAILWESTGESWAVKVSRAAERVLGHPVEAWAESGFVLTIVHPDDRVRLEDQMIGAQDRSVTVRLRHVDGTYRWMENRCTWVTDRAGRSRFAVGVLLDRTEQVEAELESTAFGHLVSSSPIGQVLLRCNGTDDPTVEAMNAAGQRLFGVDATAVGGRLSGLGYRGVDAAALIALVATGETDRSTEILGLDGRIHQATVRRLDQHSCSIDFLDVTERVLVGEQLHAQARQDYLTGLPNRRAFIEYLEALVDSGQEPSVVIIDLDDFKDINDSLGHETGDQLLCEIGQRIVAAAGDDDLVARLGGDEFAMVLADPSAVACLRRATFLVEQIHQPVIVGELRLRVRASAGLATWASLTGDRSVAELVRCADVAMYSAKTHGSRAELYQPGADRFDKQRLSLVAELETALAENQLILYHQPLIDVATRRVVGSEVLARWHHPELGVVPPDVFIELAEVSGQVKNLTRWAIRQALVDLLALGPGSEHLEVSVNLSVRNLYEADLCEWLSHTFEELGVSGRRLVVELTESTMMDDQSAAIDVIESLRGLGVRTWIDDFGTGHSSFARLRTLPVDGVKIDRTFVSGTSVSSNDEVLLRSLITLLHSLGLTAIAEGVEDLSTMDLLDSLGCDRAQGYALARPMPFADLAERVAGSPLPVH